MCTVMKQIMHVVCDCNLGTNGLPDVYVYPMAGVVHVRQATRTHITSEM